ncbi:hypothetical protein [Clostridium sp. BJN0001]|uniref:hypothetical protein n=1 Tax=Clostridium sp. BJN0001 TaxID=2930219 RepID=UPI001FD16E2B|nr:hypothetical protein [Clostridium sp. BJN0001]
MKYKDYTEVSTGEKYINGHYVGVKHGTPTPDELDKSRTGYEMQKDSIRVGTISQDKLETVNKLVIESEGEANG